ncbi:ATP-binding cassette domain-containing protein [Nocardioides sp. TF02-7]|uniref:ATP-binding cassette domain-containing protein n=1 Tax=Nocardioides sp. TF02-7 TaxID=2917724 RepID=UPI0031F54764
MITIESLTKRYGAYAAVDNVTFTAEPGRVTGFLGPNGAGKSTTMRVMVGLTEPSSGSVRVLGRRFADLPNPGREVGGPPRRVRPARRPHRPRDPHHRRAHHGPAQGSGRRDDHAGRPDRRGGRPPGAELLPRHAPAARHRHRAPR